jgi:hypothetical protein
MLGPIPSIFLNYSFRWEHDGPQLEHNTQIQYGVTNSCYLKDAYCDQKTLILFV